RNSVMIPNASFSTLQRACFSMAAATIRTGSSSPDARAFYIPNMATQDFTEEDYSDLAALVREAIDAEPYRIGPRMNKLKRLLAKLEPESDKPAATVFPAPMPSAQPSLLYQNLRGGRRRR
ncbi:MAG TPA: hypothetical protein VJS43_01905, partial [Candidatus Acidoferrales bacterium]|nr:hypothetical protein [Candidatus Acidoferrales bacterium]